LVASFPKKSVATRIEPTSNITPFPTTAFRAASGPYITLAAEPVPRAKGQVILEAL